MFAGVLDTYYLIVVMVVVYGVMIGVPVFVIRRVVRLIKRRRSEGA